VNLPDRWSRANAVFDDEHLVSCAGLVPVMGLAERTGLSELIGQRVRWKSCRVASAGANPAGKLAAITAGMAVGADYIDDLNLIRCGGMRRLFGGVYAPATLGQTLREFTHGHTLQLASVLRAHLVNLVTATGLLPGLAEQAFIDVDSLLRPTPKGVSLLAPIRPSEPYWMAPNGCPTGRPARPSRRGHSATTAAGAGLTS
jgi:hypothetical protein